MKDWGFTYNRGLPFYAQKMARCDGERPSGPDTEDSHDHDECCELYAIVGVSYAGPQGVKINRNLAISSTLLSVLVGSLINQLICGVVGQGWHKYSLKSGFKRPHIAIEVAS